MSQTAPHVSTKQGSRRRVIHPPLSTDSTIADSPTRPIAVPIFGQRFPTSHIIRYGRATSKITQLRDPYSNKMKDRFEDAYRADAIVRVAINRKVQFMLGKRGKTILDVAKEYATEEEAKKALADVVNNEEYQKMKSWIDQINRKVKFHQKLKSAVIQCIVGGRSALFIEKDAKDYPADLKVLNWQRLGQVKVDVNKWIFRGVQYTEFQPPNDILLAEDILYFTNDDYHVSPNTMFYGLSAIEGLAHISESNRIMNEMDFKEMNRSLWAAFGILKFQTRNDAEIQAFLHDFVPGIWTATNQNVEIEVHKIATELKSLLEERELNNKEILRGLEIPAPLMGYEQVTNRSTLQWILGAWKESVLEDNRTWVRDMVEPQWYDTLTRTYLKIESEEEWFDLDVKVKQAFEDITFETLEDKVSALLPLFVYANLPITKLYETLNMDDIVEEVKQREEEMLKRQQELQNQENEQFTQQGFPTQKQPGQQEGQAPGINEQGRMDTVDQSRPIGKGKHKPIPPGHNKILRKYKSLAGPNKIFSSSVDDVDDSSPVDDYRVAKFAELEKWQQDRANKIYEQDEELFKLNRERLSASRDFITNLNKKLAALDLE